MKKMLMSDAEIRTGFRQAKDQSHAITVLADLNCVSRGEMKKYLEDIGLLEAEKTKTGAKTRVDWEKVRALYQQGKLDKEIGREMGCSAQSVMMWRKKNGLKSNWVGLGGAPQEVRTDAVMTPEKAEEAESKAPAEDGRVFSLAKLAEVLNQSVKGFPEAKITVEGRAVRDVQVLIRYAGGELEEVSVNLSGA